MNVRERHQNEYRFDGVIRSGGMSDRHAFCAGLRTHGACRVWRNDDGVRRRASQGHLVHYARWKRCVLVDVILPATDSPAASAADAHYFIDRHSRLCQRGQKTFRAALALSASISRARARAQVTLLKTRRRYAGLRPVVLQILRTTRCPAISLQTGATKALAYEASPVVSICRSPPTRSVGNLMAAPNQFDAIVVSSACRAAGRRRTHGEGLEDAGAGAGRNIRHITAPPP
jgi:hypothetical protein